MMSYSNVFKRYELKFLLTVEQYRQIKPIMNEFMCGDEYGESEILNIYYDTPNYLLIRRSLEKPVYKEKLRVRSYGIASKNSDVFVEIKKKYGSVVYKRRIVEKEGNIVKILSGKGNKTQIGKEIDYFISYYKNLSPKMVISYRREAFYAKNDREFRITFDNDILWRNYDLSLKCGIYGKSVLPEEKILMEVKTASSFPLWLTRFLSANAIYKTSFSKYGTAYMQFLKETIQGEQKYA